MRSLVLVLLFACATPVRSDNERFVDDRSFRRDELVADLVNPTNDYSKLRLAEYATDNGWDDGLPEWNPAVVRLGTTEPATALALDIAVDDREAMLALGEQAFARYPVQLWTTQPYGTWHDNANVDGGLVEVDGAIAPSCSTCHSTPDANGQLVAGLANATLDLGWGPGRLDVTTTDGHEPVRIPDLRPVAQLGYLHADATLRQRDIYTLATRIETLIIVAHAQSIRPPRIVALALAEYVWSLAPAPLAPPSDAVTIAGRDVFEASCAGCHSGDGFNGEPVPLDVVGTDPVVGLSRDRGTGTYRVPSLRGVADRALLLHDASVRSLTEMLDGARPSPGHRFGTDLPADQRAALIAYLDTL